MLCRTVELLGLSNGYPLLASEVLQIRAAHRRIAVIAKSLLIFAGTGAQMRNAIGHKVLFVVGLGIEVPEPPSMRTCGLPGSERQQGEEKADLE
jgi:hypothetical protein